jgi:hypothetical protein
VRNGSNKIGSPKSIAEKITPQDIQDMDDLFKIHIEFMDDRKVRWIFRGQEKEQDNNLLKTSLEKAIDSFKIERKKAPEIEKGLLRKFKRHSSIYIEHIPVFYDYMEWFALMQHYGAPTRLQDWTYSFFVAVYFAVNDMKKDAEVWAIDTKHIEESAIKIIKKKAKFKNTSDEEMKEKIKNDSCAHIPRLFEEIFMNDPKPFVLTMNPHNLNERLIIQQGIFLCPGDITKSFYKNLRANFESHKGTSINKHIRRFRITDNVDKKKEILRHLQRMNMNNATLFPGLSGFSQSLRTWFAFFPEEHKVLTGHNDDVMEYLYSKEKSCQMLSSEKGKPIENIQAKTKQ